MTEAKIVIENISREIINLYADGGKIDVTSGEKYHVDFYYKVNGSIFKSSVDLKFEEEPGFKELEEEIALALGYTLGDDS